LDAITKLVFAGGIITVILAVFVAIVVVAMPFLVWDIHTKVKTVNEALEQVAHDVTLLSDQFSVVEATIEIIERLTTETLPQNVSEEIRAELRDLYESRLAALKIVQATLDTRARIRGEGKAVSRPNNGGPAAAP